MAGLLDPWPWFPFPHSRAQKQLCPIVDVVPDHVPLNELDYGKCDKKGNVLQQTGFGAKKTSDTKATNMSSVAKNFTTTKAGSKSLETVLGGLKSGTKGRLDVSSAKTKSLSDTSEARHIRHRPIRRLFGVGVAGLAGGPVWYTR